MLRAVNEALQIEKEMKPVLQAEPPKLPDVAFKVGKNVKKGKASQTKASKRAATTNRYQFLPHQEPTVLTEETKQVLKAILDERDYRNSDTQQVPTEEQHQPDQKQEDDKKQMLIKAIDELQIDMVPNYKPGKDEKKIRQWKALESKVSAIVMFLYQEIEQEENRRKSKQTPTPSNEERRYENAKTLLAVLE